MNRLRSRWIVIKYDYFWNRELGSHERARTTSSILSRFLDSLGHKNGDPINGLQVLVFLSNVRVINEYRFYALLLDFFGHIPEQVHAVIRFTTFLSRFVGY